MQHAYTQSKVILPRTRFSSLWLQQLKHRVEYTFYIGLSFTFNRRKLPKKQNCAHTHTNTNAQNIACICIVGHMMINLFVERFGFGHMSYTRFTRSPNLSCTNFNALSEWTKKKIEYMRAWFWRTKKIEEKKYIFFWDRKGPITGTGT